MKSFWVPYILYLVIFVTCETMFDYFKDISLVYEVHTHAYNFKTIFEDDDGYIYREGNKLTYNCKRGSIDLFPSFETEVIATQLAILSCKITTTPLVETLRALNITIDSVKTLYIEYDEEDPLPPANHTIGLNLTSFGIRAVYTKPPDFFIHNPYFLMPMEKLNTLMLSGTKMPSLPESIQLKALSLHSYASISNWEKYCTHLELLNIDMLLAHQLPEHWPESCSNLVALKLERLDQKRIDVILKSNISKALSNLKALYLGSNDLKKLPYELIKEPTELIQLDLSGNMLSENSFAGFPMLKNLSVLNLAVNQLNGYLLFDVLSQMPNLRELDLSYNSIFNLFCNYKTNISVFTSLAPKLERLSFEGTEMNLACFDGAKFENLKYLNLMSVSKSTIRGFKLKTLPRTKSEHLHINLGYHIMENIEFNENDYRSLKNGNFSAVWGTDDYKNTKFTIEVSEIDCDCDNYWFTKAIREHPDLVLFEDPKCRNTKVKYYEQPLETFNCTKLYDSQCVLRNYPNRNGSKSNITVDCTGMRGNLVLPNIRWKMLKINVSNNYIESFQDTKWAKETKVIDLSGNRISRLDDQSLTELFAIPDRHVYLSRNLLICDCDSKSMLDAFHKHQQQIVDFEEIICVDSNRTLSSVTSYEVCLIGQRTALVIAGTIAAILLILAVIIWRYRLPIQIYLYSRGWCLFCFSIEEEDSHRPFDAFLSFSHGDENYVVNELLEKLEGEPDYFRICVHYRDWLIGDWIPTQIMRSVSISKRTIIVLSRNFVQSQWGSLEFRYAVASAAKEGRSRLLLLVLDDVLSDDLDVELQGYLSYNTYLRCDDPWFWEKLRFSMPRRKPMHMEAQEPQQPDGLGVFNIERQEIVQMEPLANN